MSVTSTLPTSVPSTFFQSRPIPVIALAILSDLSTSGSNLPHHALKSIRDLSQLPLSYKAYCAKPGNVGGIVAIRAAILAFLVNSGNYDTDNSFYLKLELERHLRHNSSFDS